MCYDHLSKLGNKIPKVDLFPYSAGDDIRIPWRIISLFRVTRNIEPVFSFAITNFKLSQTFAQGQHYPFDTKWGSEGVGFGKLSTYCI